MSGVTTAPITSLTSAPVQNIGHLVQGSSRALCNHVLRYGLRTIRGRTGGVREARATLARSAARAKPGERIASINDEQARKVTMTGPR
jgi:hypothetical protein